VGTEVLLIFSLLVEVLCDEQWFQLNCFFIVDGIFSPLKQFVVVRIGFAFSVFVHFNGIEVIEHL
jgi:hypothetical protein